MVALTQSNLLRPASADSKQDRCAVPPSVRQPGLDHSPLHKLAPDDGAHKESERVHTENPHLPYHALYELAPVAYLMLTPCGKVSDINHAGCQLLQEHRLAILNSSFEQYVVAEHGDKWQSLMDQIVNKRSRHSSDIGIQCGGEVVRVNVIAAYIANDKPIILVTLVEKPQESWANEHRSAGLAFESQTGILVLDDKGVILSANRTFLRLTGYSADQVVGQKHSMLRPRGRNGEAFQSMQESLAETGTWQGNIWSLRKNGDVSSEWVSVSKVSDRADGGAQHYVVTFSELPAPPEEDPQLYSLAYLDSTTGLPNRQLLQNRIAHAMACSPRHESHNALLFVDLDDFKTLDHKRGHDIGKAVLKEATRRITDTLRREDTAGRINDDQFLILLQGLSAHESDAANVGRLVGEKLRVALAQPYVIAQHDYSFTASIGVTVFSGNDVPVDTVIAQAETAMYTAKQAGRNRVRTFENSMHTAMNERASMEDELRDALGRQQLELYYQPQLDKQMLVYGAEVLLRWNHPQQGLVMPNKFIPLAEETSLILPIGQWVLETACAQIKAWSTDPAMCDLHLAVNVSIRQFQQPNFVDLVMYAVEKTGADPTRLKLEITESLFIDNIESVIDSMQQLKSIGIQFSLDDFGTGYSSLSAVLQLPLDQLKIDYLFVKGLHGKHAGLAQMIIAMGERMNLEVIAEGVETESQLDCLVSFGCHAYQGYLFATPLPLTEFDAYVRQNRSNPQS